MFYCIDDVLVRMLISSVVDSRFKPWSMLISSVVDTRFMLISSVVDSRFMIISSVVDSRFKPWSMLISSVVDSRFMLISSVVDSRFKPWSGQTKCYILMKLVFAASLLSTHHYGKRAKTGWLRSRIMCRSGTTCLPMINLILV